LPGKTLDISEMLSQDTMATRIAEMYVDWEGSRTPWRDEITETRRYLFATDTTTTTNSKLPWKNKTTIPKLTQIRDNLIANYMATLFPKRNWQTWEGASEEDSSKEKREAIEGYMEWVTNQTAFKKEVQKMVADYVDTGNCFASPMWLDERVEVDGPEGKLQTGYVGPSAKRISPLDIVFNPIADDFLKAPKIVRVIMTMGEVRKLLDQLTTEENQDDIRALFDYMLSIRTNVAQTSANNTTGSFTEKDTYLRVDGFNSFQHYLGSSYVELLYFFGDMYDIEGNNFYPNHKIIVIDRHKILSKEPNPSFFGYPPIYHAGWRVRQDNLWAMGPLANLVGLQYRIDHLENLKADVFDLNAFPPIKVKGYVEDFEWGPMERIYVGDDGDVEMITPDASILQVNNEIMQLANTMEEMAGAPKEAMGFRNPGEKTMYEVQRMENAYNRIFQNKVAQFEEYVLEPLLNGMLELARRKMDSTQVPSFNSELSFTTFMTLTPSDITGAGRIRPLAARHFAERAEILQNLNAFFTSPAWADPTVNVHFSGEKLAFMLEEFFDIEDWDIVSPYIRISEQADAQRQMQSSQEATMIEAGTPSGLTPDDADMDMPV
jgi:hypothetical protein